MGPKKAIAVVLGLSFLGWIWAAPRFAGAREMVALKVQGALPDVDRYLFGAHLAYSVLLDRSRLVEDDRVAMRNPFVSEDDVRAGANLFAAKCQGCHLGDDSDDRTEDFRRGFFRFGSGDRALYETISRGRGHTMPSFPGPSKQVWQLASYVRSVGGIAQPLGSDDDENLGGLCARCEPVEVPYDQLVASSEQSGNWLTYSGSYSSERFSALDQINRETVKGLDLKWIRQIPQAWGMFQATPLVVNETMFVTTPRGGVIAMEVETGRQLWYHRVSIPEESEADLGNRGAAILGDAVFSGTWDARLIKLDARTGSLLWEKPVADPELSYSVRAAPLALDDKVIVGVSGGDYGNRGFIDAYRASDGERLWRFYTVPGEGELGNETWAGDSWKTGGAATWVTGSYDPELNTVYWGTGNPAPDFRGEEREGDNLYSCSVVALDADSGRLKWHFQFTPHDVHDWDSAQIPVLLDLEYEGAMRKLMVWPNRNGFYYVLDRETGEFLSARPFVRQNWAERIDETGRPIVKSGSAPTDGGVESFPGAWGAANWWSPSYNASTGLLYVPYLDQGQVITAQEQGYEPGELYMSGTYEDLPGDPGESGVMAMDPISGEPRWRFPLPSRSHSGVLATAGNVVFTGSKDGFFYGLDAETGAELWRYKLSGSVRAAPVSYLLDGKQQIAIAAGKSVFAFELAN